MEKSNNGRQIITISISEENYKSIKKCADIMGLNLSLVIDKMITNKIPGDGSICWAEFTVVDALATASVNFNQKDFKQLLENLICVFEKLKNTEDPVEGKKSYLDRMQDYFTVANS